MTLKDNYLEHFAKCGRYGEAASLTGIPASTARNWRKDDPVFNRDLENVRDQFTDVAEDTLLEIMKEGDSDSTRLSAAKFFLQNRSRGDWGSRTKVDVDVEHSLSYISNLPTQRIIEIEEAVDVKVREIPAETESE